MGILCSGDLNVQDWVEANDQSDESRNSDSMIQRGKWSFLPSQQHSGGISEFIWVISPRRISRGREDIRRRENSLGKGSGPKSHRLIKLQHGEML